MRRKKRRPTAGELSQKALLDNTKYDALEVGYLLAQDIEAQLRICIDKHNQIFAEEQYCVGYLLTVS